MRAHTFFFAAIVLTACGRDEKAAAPAAPPPPLSPTASGTADPPPPPPAPTPTPTATTPPPPPEPEWEPPVVPTKSAGCSTSQPRPLGTEYLTPAGRKYNVYGPASYDADKTYPVVVMYHGIYATGPAFESWFKMEDYVDDGFVVYATATGDYWDVKNPAELTYFDDMIKGLGQTYCINPARVLAFGFSFGGSMASQVACKRAGFVKALSVGDGSWGGDAKCGRLPVLMTHRTHDGDELIAWGRTTAGTWAGLDKCATTTVAGDATMNCISYAGCKAPGAVSFCEDRFYDPSWPVEWNHTVREPYRAFTWQWFKALP